LSLTPLTGLENIFIIQHSEIKKLTNLTLPTTLGLIFARWRFTLLGTHEQADFGSLLTLGAVMNYEAMKNSGVNTAFLELASLPTDSIDPLGFQTESIMSASMTQGVGVWSDEQAAVNQAAILAGLSTADLDANGEFDMVLYGVGNTTSSNWDINRLAISMPVVINPFWKIRKVS